MINLFLAANCYGKSFEFLIRNTYDNDLKITEFLCKAGVIAIFVICVTICILMIFSYLKKDKSAKRILEDILKNDKKITELIKEKIAISNAEEVSRKLLNGSNSDFVKRVSDEVHRMNTEDVSKELLSGTNSDFIKRVSDEVCRLKIEEAIKEVLSDMAEKDSNFVKSIKDKLLKVNNNPQK